jgi:MULE transposase domain
LIALALSNKEDENMYSAMIQGVKTVLQSIGVHMDPECTMSDNCDAIQKSLLVDDAPGLGNKNDACC